MGLNFQVESNLGNVILFYFSMLHFYDSSPYSIESQTIRLEGAAAVSAARIKFLVWGDDALALQHLSTSSPPTSLLSI